MLNHDAINLIENNIEDLQAQNMPEAAADLERAVALLEQDAAIVARSSQRPAGGGMLPCRVVIRRMPGAMPFAVHFEVTKEGGALAYAEGDYCSTLAEAVVPYARRCHRLGVTEHE